MNETVQFAHALADVTRCRILHLVFSDALCVCELADILEMPQSSLSSHLQVIRKARLLESERCEKWVYYKVSREYRGLLATIFRNFPASNQMQQDELQKAIRLAQRENCDCPGPKQLPKLAKRSTSLPKLTLT
jgi:ArsR family transcriptional regulator, arsenate/arsenite/antimonite-responsive transcriptional repressor